MDFLWYSKKILNIRFPEGLMRQERSRVMKTLCPLLTNFGQILDENSKISKNIQIIKKRFVAILDKIMFRNLGKFSAFQNILNLSYFQFCKIPENHHFAFLSIFSPKLVKIFQIIVDDVLKPVKSRKFSQSSTFCEVLWLKGK